MAIPFLKKEHDSRDDGRIYGKLGSVGLNDILQMLGMTKRTATVSLERGGRKGAVFFEDGILRHAAVGGSEGEEALMKLVDWSDADFVIDEGVPDGTPSSISRNVDAVMLDVMTRLDEGYVPNVTPFPGLDKPTADDIKLMARMARPTRRKPPPPRPSVLPKVLAIAGVVAVAGLAFLGYRLLDLGETPAAVLPADWRSAKSPPGESVASATLSASLDGGSLDVWSLLESRGLTRRSDASSSSTPIPPEPTGATTAAVTATASPVPAPAAPGALLVVVEPWAEVFIDGARVGETPLPEVPVSAGAHEILLSNPNVVGVIRDRVEVPPGETLQRRYSFSRAGLLRVLVNPWADVYVDGRHIGQTPMGDVRVPVGTHTVVLRHPTLGERTHRVQVRSSETAVVRVAW